MNFDNYVNKLPYYKEGADVKAEWRIEEARLVCLFTNDLFADLGIEDNPKRDLLFLHAWNMGHSAGFKEVYLYASELVELIL